MLYELAIYRNATFTDCDLFKFEIDDDADYDEVMLCFKEQFVL